MILVVGATGQLGSDICRRLVHSGKSVRALVRDSASLLKRQKLWECNVTFVEGDLKDRSSLERACQGVDTVISTASCTASRQAGDSIEAVDCQGHLNLIHTASAARVKHFVYISFPRMPEDFPLQRAKRAVERHLITSGISYTVLQPAFFMETWLGPAFGFDPANAKARIFGSGENKTCWISLRNVGEIAAAAVSSPLSRNMVLPLGGPEALSQMEVVRLSQEACGRPFSLEYVSEETLRRERAAARDTLEESLAALKLNCARGQAVDTDPAMEFYPLRLDRVAGYLYHTMGVAATHATA